MAHCNRGLLAGTALAALALPQSALAQRAGENAVASADDAFGTQVGTESTGIYNENDTRGLSPIKAGNARLDGVYFDLVSPVSGRLRSLYGIRVGIAANDYPFGAPTGIVDNRLRSAGDKLVTSLSFTKLQYSGELEELDFQIPIIKGRLGLATGIGRAVTVTGDGGVFPSLAASMKPVIRLPSLEVSPFIAWSSFYDISGRPIFTTTGALVPALPELGHYLGQSWARGHSENFNVGVVTKAALSSRLTLRAGIFRSSTVRLHNYTEVFSFTGPGRIVTHRLISDPKQHLYSWSGEAQLAWKLGDEAGWQSRLLAGYRARKRYTESGGSDFRNFGTIDIDGFDPESEPAFAYGPLNQGRVDQSAIMLGYQGRLGGLGMVNLGLQRARYRASFLNAATGRISTSRDDPWLYNASFAFNLTTRLELFGGTQKGLEDSGAAPENAANRNEQLPTTRSTQYEAGLRWGWGKSHIVVSLFQIAKPYFSFDAGGRFIELGTARYRGAEFSLAGHLGPLTLLAGAVAMAPEVTGPGRTAGLVGKRPAGTPDVYGKLDLQYRTGLLGGLTPTVTFTYTGRRAVGSAPVAALGGAQSMLAPTTSLDLGARLKFKAGKAPASFRANLQNVFDHRGWKVFASNSLQPEEGRRFTFTVAADF